MMLDMLGRRFDLAICTSLDRAIDMLGDRIGLIICGDHFDQGRMPDLLHASKTQPTIAPIPFLGVRLFDDEPDNKRHGIVRATANMLGSDGFLDVAQWKRSVGDDYAKAKLRICVDYMALDQRQVHYRDGEQRKKLQPCGDVALA